MLHVVVIGGIAAIAQGYPLPTEDVDVTPVRDPENLERLASALTELGARLRVPKGKPAVAFPIDSHMLAQAESWTLATRHGDLDLMFLPAGTRGFDDLRRDAASVALGSTKKIRVLVVIRSNAAGSGLSATSRGAAITSSGFDATMNMLAGTVRAWRGTRAFTAAPRRPEKLLGLYDIEASPYGRLVREVLTELDLDVLEMYESEAILESLDRTYGAASA